MDREVVGAAGDLDLIAAGRVSGSGGVEQEFAADGHEALLV